MHRLVLKTNALLEARRSWYVNFHFHSGRTPLGSMSMKFVYALRWYHRRHTHTGYIRLSHNASTSCVKLCVDVVHIRLSVSSNMYHAVCAVVTGSRSRK